MINGMILNQSIYNENSTDSIDFEIGLALENMMLKQQLALINKEEYLTESQGRQVLIGDKELKYVMKKWRDKERALPEIDKDIAKCDKVLSKINDKLKKYEGKPKIFKVKDNILNILALFVPIGQLFTSNAYHIPGVNGLDNDISVGKMAINGEIESPWEFYKRDLILCKKETEATKKFLIELKKKKQKQK